MLARLNQSLPDGELKGAAVARCIAFLQAVRAPHRQRLNEGVQAVNVHFVDACIFRQDGTEVF
jgi:hypothetical protein